MIFLPGRGRRDPHIDVQGTFHHSEQWLAFKEYEKRKYILMAYFEVLSFLLYQIQTPLTIQQRQRLTQCVAGTQKQLRMGLGPKLFSGLASSDREKLIFGKKIYCFLFVRSILFHLTGSKGNKAKKKSYPQHLGLFSSIAIPM